jgi:tRNA pseudouridine38-40 synthase
VHAEAQVAAFATSRALPPRRWVLAINRYLPSDVAVQNAAPCAPEYDPRYDALDKTYRYLFQIGFARHPLYRTRAWHLARDVHARNDDDLTRVQAGLDLERMQQACSRLVGTHDFRAFRSADDIRENSRRTLHRVALIQRFAGEPNLLALEVQGSAFMKNMVRILAGTLVAVGRGTISLDEFDGLLRSDARRHPQADTAPGHGLTLVAVTLGRAALAAASR